MTGSGSPCGACKFLRRKCMRGCVFAPYFCHEHGASHFAAIHKVFGASNVSKLLAHLPVSDRSEAAVTISYEAQARLQDPIYGCVSHIFALQQQVVNLQAQLAYLREQAAQSFHTENPNEKYCGKPTTATNFPHDLHGWFQSQNSDTAGPHHEFLPNMSNNYGSSSSSNPFMNLNPMGNNNEESMSFSSFDETASNNSMSYDVLQANSKHWGFHEVDDLQSVAFGFCRSAS
ncbi:hypothetical protein K1719_006633 [Acacia pycnantha]|nr:hypothetical protein K1719_046090 [Acacia pycnantha]KAI9121944.1 hypothetical protein K1719_006633 [Acacia pycnantha]